MPLDAADAEGCLSEIREVVRTVATYWQTSFDPEDIACVAEYQVKALGLNTPESISKFLTNLIRQSARRA